MPKGQGYGSGKAMGRAKAEEFLSGIDENVRPVRKRRRKRRAARATAKERARQKAQSVMADIDALLPSS